VCGSTRRVFNEHVQTLLTLYQCVTIKQKRPGFKKPIQEQTTGAVLTKSSGRFNNKVQIFDRLNDWYYECITEPETGNILYKRDEPLSHHYGRGTARFQNHGIPHEYIVVAAYYIWEKSGRGDGNDKAHWNMALEDLKRAAAGVPMLYI
jgi:hypothetical protein